MLALNETAAHLDFLTSQGLLIADQAGPLRHYRSS
jgi:hypothetical protein